MMNRIYWSETPSTWKRAAPAQSIPSVPSPFEFDTKAPADAKTFRFVVSTGTVDRSGDTINQAGWQLKSYRRNPVVLYAHDAGAWPVGKATSIGVEGDKLVASVQFADTFEGKKVRHLVETGVLKATSVGFRPIESKMSSEKGRVGSYDFISQELMEFSVCPVPANPDCLLTMSATESRAGDIMMDLSGNRYLKTARRAKRSVEGM
jgi:HK97 family phage prohead protease